MVMSKFQGFDWFWHFCIIDNSQLDQELEITLTPNFSKLEERGKISMTHNIPCKINEIATSFM